MDPDIPLPSPIPPPFAPSAPVELRSDFSSDPSFRIPATNISSNDGELTEEQISTMSSFGFTRGLSASIGRNNTIFPLRYWIVDNSGSMANTDGSRYCETKKGARSGLKVVSCTRWKEIQETVEFHARMAALLCTPTVFLMINPPGGRNPQEFGIANKGTTMISSDLEVALQTISKSSPGGVTPLVKHIKHVQQEILKLKPQLESEGRKVCVILATDGLPTDENGIGGHQQGQEFVTSLKSLESLPVWVVVRLCTDEEHVVDFYNDLDSQLELSLEVLDDFAKEAKEIYKHNSWLNYSLPVHRIREGGFENRLFDLLDERPLTKSELRDFCILILGQENFDGVPEPDIDFSGFLRAISKLINKEDEQWNPIKKKMMPIINIKQMGKDNGEACCIM